MKVKRLRIHYYAEEYEKRNLMSIILYIARMYEYENLKWYIKRDWKYGPHIGVYLRHEKGNGKIEDSFLKKIQTEIEDYWKKNPTEVIIKTDEKVLEQLAQLENYSGEYLPICDHCTCVKERIDIKSDGYYNTNKEYLFFQKQRIASRYLVLETVEVLKNMDKEKQYLFLVAMFKEVAECYPEEGLLKGCISFKSHVVGFLGNADSRTEILKKRFEQVYEYMCDDLKLVEQTKYDFNIAQKLIDDWKSFFQTFIDEIPYNEQAQIKIKKDSDLVEKSIQNLGNYTEFHNKWVNRSKFSEFFFSQEFYHYRMLVNFFYLILPNLGFGPEEKHLGCYLITKTIEEMMGIDFMNMIST